MTAELTIRAATKADASEVAVLVNIATHGGMLAGWQHDERAEAAYDPLDVGRLDMLDETDGLNWRNASMAESDGEIVGMLLGYPQPEQMPAFPDDLEDFLVPIVELEWLTAETWFISMLGVHLAWRSHGVGSRLLALAEAKRAETQRRGLSLIVEDRNEGARALYERMGYAVRASRPMRQFPDGTQPGKDWLLMVKDTLDG